MDGWMGGLGSNACRDFCILTLQRAHTPERESEWIRGGGRGAGGEETGSASARVTESPSARAKGGGEKKRGRERKSCLLQTL
jgi:hypothetical protein